MFLYFRHYEFEFYAQKGSKQSHCPFKQAGPFPERQPAKNKGYGL